LARKTYLDRLRHLASLDEFLHTQAIKTIKALFSV
jgi:hypothetical protein